MQKNLKIGVFGGAFDPVHEGHVSLALYAKKTCNLDVVLFIPTAQGPHKRHQASFFHRVAMLQKALAGSEALQLSLLEAERNAPSYTFDTMEELHRRLPQAEFYFLAGSDSLLDLPSWYKFRDLLQTTNFIIAPRGGIETSAITEIIQKLPEGYTLQSGSQYLWLNETGRTIEYLCMTPIDISSSAIRKRIRAGMLQIPHLQDQVLQYIQKHNLYLA